MMKERERWHASSAFLHPLLQPRLPTWSIPDYHEVARSPTVGRFTYKFNKHISYLMHALSRECFDRPGPPSSSSTCVFSSLCVPHAPFPPSRALRSIYARATVKLVVYFFPFFSFLDSTACRKYRKLTRKTVFFFLHGWYDQNRI